jgi:hypothetical protein
VQEGAGFEFLGREVEVRSAQPATSAWLTEVTAPCFAASVTGPAALVFEIGAAPAAAEPEGEALGPTPCFALDHGVVDLPAWRAGETVVLEDAFFRCQYTVAPGRVAVAPLGGPHHLRGGSLRAVREALLASVEWRDRVQLHAAAVVADGRAIVFAGAREAGKTSLLAHVAGATGAAVMANDRVVLTRDGSGWDAIGVPTVVTVRPGTIALLPGRFEAWTVPADGQPVMLSRAESQWAERRPLGATTELLRVSLAQLAAGLGAPLARRARLACVALLSIDDGLDAYSLRPFPAGGAWGAGFGPPHPATVFDQVLGGLGRARTDAAPADLPCVELAVGRALFERDPSRLLAELLDVG